MTASYPRNGTDPGREDDFLERDVAFLWLYPRRIALGPKPAASGRLCRIPNAITVLNRDWLIARSDTQPSTAHRGLYIISLSIQ